MWAARAEGQRALYGPQPAKADVLAQNSSFFPGRWFAENRWQARHFCAANLPEKILNFDAYGPWSCFLHVRPLPLRLRPSFRAYCGAYGPRSPLWRNILLLVQSGATGSAECGQQEQKAKEHCMVRNLPKRAYPPKSIIYLSWWY